MVRVPTVKRDENSKLDALPNGMAYHNAYKRMWIAYVLNLAGLGVFGAHRFYLRYHQTGLIQLSMFFGYILLEFISETASTIVMVALVLWVLADLFLIPRLTRERNAQIAADIDRQIEEMRRGERAEHLP